MTRDTGDLLQNMLPSGGWGSFLLLKDPISLTREHQSYENETRENASPPYTNQDSLYATVPHPVGEDTEFGRINLAVCLTDERKINAREELHGRRLFRI